MIHIRMGSSDDIQEKVECQITELFFHIKIKNMTKNDECKMMFVELLSTSLSPASSHSFIAKLSHPITLHAKSRVGIQNIRTEGSCNIFRENLSIKVEKSLN